MANTIEEITTPLGTFELFDNGCNSLHPSKNWETGLRKAVRGTVFEKEGKKGIRLYDEIIVPPYYDEIGIVSNPDRIYLIRGGRYDYFGRNWVTGGYYEADSHFIFKDKKMGWEREGKVVVQPLYDDVEEWGFRVYETRNGSDIKYLKEDGSEVLTFRRPIDEDYESPFWFRTDDGDVFTVFECPPKPDLPESNVLHCSDGTRVGVDRFNREVFLKELVNPDDELPLTHKMIEGLTNEFSYEFSAYRFTVKGEHPLKQLSQMIKDFGVDDNTWFYTIRLTTPPGEHIHADELLSFTKFLETNHNEALGKSIGIGHDDSLKPGEVSALIITHYNEVCFPPREQFEWIKVCKQGTLQEVKIKDSELQKYTKSDIFDEYQNDFLQDSYNTIFSNIAFMPYTERSWDETEKVLDFIATKSESFMKKVWPTVEKIMEPDEKKNIDFLLNYLEWLLRKGANPNKLKGGNTPLDVVYRTMKDDERRLDTKMLKLRNTLIRHGGLTFEKYREQYVKDHSEYDFVKEILSKEN